MIGLGLAMLRVIGLGLASLSCDRVSVRVINYEGKINVMQIRVNPF